jgi:hypothetical protein
VEIKVREALKTKDTRLCIKVKDDEFFAKWTSFININHPDLADDISPLHFEILPVELRFTLNATKDNNAKGGIIGFGKEMPGEVLHKESAPIRAQGKFVQNNGQKKKNNAQPQAYSNQAKKWGVQSIIYEQVQTI